MNITISPSDLRELILCVCVLLFLVVFIATFLSGMAVSLLEDYLYDRAEERKAAMGLDNDCDPPNLGP